MREAKVNVEIVDQFSVFDFDGTSKVSGLSGFNVSVWCNAVPRVRVVDVVEIGSSGEYRFAFTPDIVGVWKVEIIVGFTADVFASEFMVMLGTSTDVYEDVKRLLGLNHENIFIDRTVYDANSQMIGARVRLFASREECDLATSNGDEMDGVIATYELSTTWDAINKFNVFKQVHV